MKWQNLKDNKCPYCESRLVFDGDQEIGCTSCRFIISPVRFKAIAEKRSDPSNRVGLKWQNLRRGQCPQCGNDLMLYGKYEVTVCIKRPICTFTIGQDKYDAIMADPMHPAHQYD